jgi:hypothetical protein
MGIKAITQLNNQIYYFLIKYANNGLETIKRQLCWRKKGEINARNDFPPPYMAFFYFKSGLFA